MAEEHHAVCYDTNSTDVSYLSALAPHSIGETIDELHDAIESHLTTADFAAHQLELIALRGGSGASLARKRARRQRSAARRKARKERARKRRSDRKQRKQDRNMVP